MSDVPKFRSRSKIKVLYLSGALSYGGLERVVINLCKGLDRETFDPLMLCIKNQGEFANELMKEGVPLFVLNANRSRFAKYTTWYSIRRLVKKEKIRIIHSHNTGPFIDGCLAALGDRRRVLIHTDHGRSFPDKMRYMLAEHYAARIAKRIVAVSHELKENLMRYERIPGDKITVIQNGVDPRPFDVVYDRPALRKKLGLENFEHVLGLGVVIREQKGIIHLIKAAPRILYHFPRTAFLIAGDGPAKLDLEHAVHEAGLSSNFIFLGKRQDMPNILQALDIYVFPSEKEGLPLSVLEAMAARKCILATRVGGLPAVLRDKIDAMLVPPRSHRAIAENAIKLLGNPQLRARLGNSARESFYQNFTVDRMIERYERLYIEEYYAISES